MTFSDVLQLVGVAALAVVLTLVVRFRRRGKATHDLTYATDNVCPHLKPALDLLLSRGHTILQVGQKAQEFPLEIHVTPPFDPEALFKELKLEPPVQVSERNVIFCKDDWCELCPAK